MLEKNTTDVMRKVNSLLSDAWVLVYQHAVELGIEQDFEHPLSKLRDEINSAQCKTYEIEEYEDDIELEEGDVVIEEDGTINIIDEEDEKERMKEFDEYMKNEFGFTDDEIIEK
jgi:hypothetical protein